MLSALSPSALPPISPRALPPSISRSTDRTPPRSDRKPQGHRLRPGTSYQAAFETDPFSPIRPLESFTSAAAVQEYLAALVRRDPHEVEVMIKMPLQSGEEDGEEGEGGLAAVPAVEEGVWLYEHLRRVSTGSIATHSRELTGGCVVQTDRPGSASVDRHPHLGLLRDDLSGDASRTRLVLSLRVRQNNLAPLCLSSRAHSHAMGVQRPLGRADPAVLRDRLHRPHERRRAGPLDFSALLSESALDQRVEPAVARDGREEGVPEFRACVLVESLLSSLPALTDLYWTADHFRIRSLRSSNM